MEDRKKIKIHVMTNALPTRRSYDLMLKLSNKQKEEKILIEKSKEFLVNNSIAELEYNYKDVIRKIKIILGN